MKATTETITLPTLKAGGERIENDFEAVMEMLRRGKIITSADVGAADYPLVFDDADSGAYVTAGAINAHGETMLTVEVGMKTYSISQRSRHPLPGFKWRLKG